MKHTAWVVVFLFLGCTFVSAENWPGWRGPQGNGQSAEPSVPTTWSGKKNIKWKIPLPPQGNSSPVVWGQRVFLTLPLDAKGTKRALWCIDRKDGSILWKRDVPYQGKEPTHSTNPYCSATPVTDGERVIVSFGSAGLYCYDMDGKDQWHYDVGKQIHIWGNASSPIL